MKPTRPIRIEGDVAYVPLTKGYVAIIDVEDVPLVQGQNWCAYLDRNTVYAKRKGPMPERRTICMHRIIMGDPLGLEVDHRDGNGLNNRKRGETGNLRVATRSQNAQNQAMSVRNTSEIKGVSWEDSRQKWRADIKVNCKNVAFGRFDSKEAAGARVREKRLVLHSEFAREA